MTKVNRQQGFSILELLIALTLGLVVVAGIVQLFTGNSRTYEIVNAQARLQENARYSFQFITRFARDAGYFGCAPEAELVVKGLNGNWNAIPEYNMSEPIDGFEANGDGTYLPNNLLTLPRTEGGANTNVHVAGNGIDGGGLDPASDILIFRSLRKPVARLTNRLQPDGDPQVYTPGGSPQFAVDDVVVVSDCEQAALFRVTGLGVAGDVTTLAHATNAGGNPFDNGDTITTYAGDVLPATMSILGRSYGAAATVGVFETTIFFIAPSTQANNAGENINALWQKSGSRAPVELVQGVENMQVLYGVDSTPNDGITNVNQYREIQDVADVNAIVVVQVSLDISSVDALVGTGGDRLRRTYTNTVSLRNAGV
jgi:type IV pilus assembly protein PilW